jgi:hypothetical protein
MFETDFKLSGHFKIPTIKLENGDVQIEWPEALYTQLIEAEPDGKYVLTACKEKKDRTVRLCLYPLETWNEVEEKLMAHCQERNEHQRFYWDIGVMTSHRTILRSS